MNFIRLKQRKYLLAGLTLLLLFEKELSAENDWVGGSTPGLVTDGTNWSTSSPPDSTSIGVFTTDTYPFAPLLDTPGMTPLTFSVKGLSFESGSLTFTIGSVNAANELDIGSSGVEVGSGATPTFSIAPFNFNGGIVINGGPAGTGDNTSITTYTLTPVTTMLSTYLTFNGTPGQTATPSTPSGGLVQINTTFNAHATFTVTDVSSTTINSLTTEATSTVLLGNQLAIYDPTGSYSSDIAGPIQDYMGNPGSIYIQGLAQVQLDFASNTYSGGTQIGSGSQLTVFQDGSLGKSDPLVPVVMEETSSFHAGEGGTVLSKDRNIQLIAGSTHGNALFITGANAFQINGVISETGGSYGFTLKATGAAPLVLRGLNTFTGKIAAYGVVNIVTDQNLGLSDTLVLDNPGGMYYGGTLQAGSSVTLPMGRTIQVNADGMTLDPNGNTLTIQGVITDLAHMNGYNVNIADSSTGGNGTVALRGTNTFGSSSGGTGLVVGPGTVNVIDDSNLGASGAPLTLGQPTFKGILQAGADIDTLTRQITLGSSTAFFDTNNHSITVPGTITDGGNNYGFFVLGGGTLVLPSSGTTSLGATSPGISVLSGTLNINGDANLGSNPVPLTMAAGSTLQASGSFTISNMRTLTFNALSVAGQVTIDTNGNPCEIDSDIGQMSTLDCGLTLIGGSTLTLSGSNSYGGPTQINNGSLVISVDGSLTGGDVSIASGSTLDISSSSPGIPTIGNLTGNGAIQLGPNSLTANISNPNVVFGGSMQDGSVGGSFTKERSGTLTLSGDQTFTGECVIATNGGTLIVDGSMVSGVTVGDYATLAGTGAIQGDVQLDPSGMGYGHIQPGDPQTLGSQQYLGNLDMSNGGFLSIGVNPTKTSAAIVTGTATLNALGGSSVTITPEASPDYVALTYSPFLSAGTLTGSFPTNNQDLGSYPNLNPQLVTSGQSISLQLTAGGTFTWSNTAVDANDPASWVAPMMRTGVPLSGDIGEFPDDPSAQPGLNVESMSIGTLKFDKTGYQFSLSSGSTLNLSSGPGTGVINNDSSVSTEFLVSDSSISFYRNGGYSGSGGTTTYTLTGGSNLNFNSTAALYPNGQDPMGGSVRVGLTASNFTIPSGGAPTTIDVLNADGSSQISLGAALTIAGSGSQEIDGSIVDTTPSSGSLIYSGSGTLTLMNAANSYSGGTQITGTGTLAIHNAAIPSGGNLFVGDSATFDMSDGSVSTLIIGDLTGSGNISLGTNTLTAGTTTPSVTFSGVMSDGALGGSLTKQGTGTLNLTSVQTFTGACTVNAGTLAVVGLDASVGGVSTVGGTTLSATGTINGAVVIGAASSAATLQTSGTLTLNSTLDISTNNSTLEIGIDPSTISAVVVNAGTTALAQANLVVVPQVGLYGPTYSPTLLTSALTMGDTFATTNLGGYPGFNPSLSYNYMGGTVSLVLTGGKTFTWQNSSSNLVRAGSWAPSGGPPSSGDTGYFASEATVSPTLSASASQWIGTLEFASPGTTFYVSGSSTLDLSSGATTGVVNDFNSGDGVTTFNISDSSAVNFYENGGSAGSGGTTVYYLSSSSELNFNATNPLYPNGQTTNGIYGSGLVQIVLNGSQFNTAGASGVVTTIDSLSADTYSTVTLGGQLVLGNDLDQTIGGAIRDVSSVYPGSLSYQGSGTLTLGGTNTYSGGTTINATGATLALSNSTAILAGSAVTVTRGTFDISGATPGVQIGDLTGAGSVVLGSNTLTVGTANSVSFNGGISGLGGLTKMGTGALTLNNVQSFTGVCEVAEGTLILNEFMEANVLVDSGATLGGNGVVDGSTTAMGTVKPDSPSLTFNTGLDLTNGTLSIDISPSQTNVASVTSGGVTLSNSDLVITPKLHRTYTAGTYPFLVVSDGGLPGSFSSADLGSAVTYGFTPFLTYRNSTSGAGSVALTLFSGDVFTWTNTVSDVTAMGAWDPESPTPGANDIGVFPVNPLAHPPGVGFESFSINSFYFDASGTTFSVEGTLNIGSGGINNTGSSYQTTFNVDGGIINFGDGASACNWGTAIYNASIAGEIAFNSTTTSNGQATGALVQIALTGGSFVIANHVEATIDSLSATMGGNTVELAATLTLGNSGAQTIDAAIADYGMYAGALTYQGSGTLTLTGTNTYGGGTTISSTGTLATSGTGILPSGGDLSFTDAGIFDASQSSVGPSIKTISGTDSSAQINLGTNALSIGSGSFGGSINDGGIGMGHGASLTVAGPGTLTLTNATNGYTGGTTISDGATLNIAADGSLGAMYMGSYGGLTMNGASTLQAGADLTLNSGRTITLNAGAQFDAFSNAVEIDGTLTGAGSLTLIDSSMAQVGSLTLPTGTTFAGAITAYAGTLIIDGLPNAASVAVASGATLQGTGTVANAVTSSGTIYPGAPTLPGTLTLSVEPTLNTGSELYIEFSSMPTISAVAVTGNVDITNTTLYIDPFSGSGYTDAGNPYTFLTATGTITTPFTGTPHLGSYSGYNASLDYGTAHQVSLVLTPGRTFTWTGGTSTDADNSANWMVTGMAGVPQSGDIALFSSVPTNQPALSLSSESMDIGTLQFNVSGITFTVSTSNSLTLGTGDGTGVLNMDSSIHSTFAIDGGTVSLSDLGGSASDNGTTTYTLTSGGTLNFLATGSSPSNGQTNSGLVEITLDGGSTFTLADVGATIDSLSSTNDGMTPNSVSLGSTLTLGNSSQQTLGAQISGSGGLTYQGSSTLILTNRNTYGGNTEIVSGTINITNNRALGVGILQMSGGSLQAGADVMVANDVTLNTASSFDTQTHKMTLGGTISGDFTLTKNGSGILALTADNSGAFGSSSHGVTVSQGTLQISNDNNLGVTSAPLTLQASTLQASGDFTLSSSRPIDLSSGGIIDTNGNTIEIDSKISGTALKVINSGSGGSLTLGSTMSDYTGGMTIDGAVVVISSDGLTGPLGTPAGALTFDVSATSTLQAGGSFTFAAARNIQLNGTGVIDTQGQVVSQDAASTGKIAGSGTLQILGTGVSSFNGQFTLINSDPSSGWNTIVGSSTSGTAAKLTLSGSNAKLGSGTLNIHTGSRLEFISGAPNQSIGALSGGGSISLGGITLTSTTSTSSQFDGQITGSGSFNFNGSSPSTTLTITGNQAFTGLCTVQGGTLILGTSGSQTTAGPVTVNSGAVLKGIGTINGLVTIQSGGTLQPGTSVGTQTFATGLDLQADSNLVIEINDAGGASLAEVLMGDVTLSGVTLTILKDSGNYTARVYPPILTTDTGVIHDEFMATNLGTYPGLIPGLQYNTNSVVFSLTAPPGIPLINVTPGNNQGTAQYLNSLPPYILGDELGRLAALNSYDLNKALASIAPTRNAIPTFVSQNISFELSSIVNERSSRLHQLRLLDDAREGAGKTALSLLDREGNFLAQNSEVQLFDSRSASVGASNAPSLLNNGWLSGFGMLARQAAQNEVPKFNFTSGGVVGGYDHTFNDNAMAGIAVAYVYTNYSTNEAGQGHLNTGLLSLYSTTYVSNWYFELSLWNGMEHVKNTRDIAYPGYSQKAASSYNTYQGDAHFGCGYDYNFNVGSMASILEPFVAVDWACTFASKFTERGEGVYDMSVKKRFSSMLRSEVGINNYFSWVVGDGNIVLRDKLSYVNKAPFKTGVVNAQIVGAPNGYFVDSFTTNQNLFSPALEFAYKRNKGAYASFTYEGEFGSGYIANEMNIKIGTYF